MPTVVGDIPRSVRGSLSAAARQTATLRETAHRPWPLPDGAWLQGQTWEDLLFAHWRADERRLRAVVPAELELDRWDGSAWLGITPFRVVGLRLRGAPPLPLLSTFPELNVRTYVSAGGKPGIWFFSLDAAGRLVVEAARRTYRLPYHRAHMEVERVAGRIRYRSSRAGAERPYDFEASYEPAGPVFRAEPRSIEHFLAERYCLYTRGRDGHLARAEIHHPPWPLQAAEAELARNTMPPDGVVPGEGPLLHFSARQDVVIWPLEPA